MDPMGYATVQKKNEAWNIVEPRHDQWYPVVILGILTNHDSHRTNVL